MTVTDDKLTDASPLTTLMLSERLQVPHVVHAVVIDTNIVLDMWVYADPAVQALKAALADQSVQWWVLPRMRDELQRVLTYPHIAKRLQRNGQTAQDVLQHGLDTHALLHTPVAKAAYTCKDADDQMFIDLACALAMRGAPSSPSVDLVSKDLHVLRMRSRLARLGVRVMQVWSDQRE